MDQWQDNSFYTHPRLNNFVKNYSEYKDQLTADTQNGIELYNYFHFEYSPAGIQLTDIGRIPSSFLISDSKNETDRMPNMFSLMDGLNTPEGWKLQLGKTIIQTKETDIVLHNGKYIDQIYHKAGLKFKVIPLPSNLPTNIDVNFFVGIVNRTHFIDLFEDDNNVLHNCYGHVNNFDTFDGMIDGITQSIGIELSKVTNSISTIGIEWTGFFKPSEMGTYQFNIPVQNGYLLAWIGDKSVCEYIPSNSDATSTTASFSFPVTDLKYYPVRIQLFSNIFSDSRQVMPSISIHITSGNKTVDTSSVFYTLKHKNRDTPYIPKLFYCAFVSTSINTYKPGQFQLYLCDPMMNDVKSMYKTINIFKYDMYNKRYDRDFNGSILEYGTLPDIGTTKGVNYTPVSTDPTSLPERFSLYRIDTDVRMGKTFQIDTPASGGPPYTMHLLDPSLVTYDNNYHNLYDYYPDSAAAANAIALDPVSCKERCNNSIGTGSSPDCKYYFTYKKNGRNYCVQGTDDAMPQFNQVRSQNMDSGSGSLNLRNYKLVQPPKCEGDLPSVLHSKITNTTEYGNTFPYAKYTWDPENVVHDINSVGVCGDKTYKQLQNDAAKILYENAFYLPDGEAYDKNKNALFTENMSTFEQAKDTNVTQETREIAENNLKNHEIYAQNMVNIDQNYNDLSKNIEKYNELKHVMASDNHYDFSGNVLLYFRNQAIHTVRQQNVADTSEEYVKQNLLYSLGMITMATLVVLAIVLGRN
jgi:hypothetical protein